MAQDKKLPRLHEDVLMPDQNLPVWAFYFEHEVPGGLFDMHWHEHFEMIYLVEGAMDIDCEGSQIHIKPGELMVVNPNEMHSCPHIEVPLKLYCVIFDVEMLKGRFLDKSEAKYMQPILHNEIMFENFLGEHSLLAECVQKVCRETEQKDRGYELAIKAEILNILVILLRKYLVRVLTDSEKETKIRNNSRIRSAVEYIHAHYTEELHVEQVAEAIFISKFYLCKIFKKNLGQTVVEYIHDVRIHKARQLLLEGDFTVAEVASLVGFDDFNYFSRIYKRRTGETPSETRKGRKTDKAI